MTHKMKLRHAGLTLAAGALTLAASAANADQVITDDLIVQGSICAGQDCVNGESFGFDTLRLKENNLRIKFQDTSNSGSFPSRDWQITANDSSNGGANKFSIDDIDGGRTPFTIEAGAPSHSLFVDDGGRVGLGTSTPVVELHIPDGDTPTLRLEQDGTSGFTPQTWDVAGNETNFFVRDVTNGSRLPFKIRPSAPTNSLYVNTNGDVGFGTAAPTETLHVVGTGLVTSASGDTRLTVLDTNATSNNGRILLKLTNNGASQLSLESTDPAHVSDWRVQNFQDTLRLTRAGTNEVEFELDAAGNLTTFGTVNGSSDKNRKMAIQDIDSTEILEKIAAMPVSSWTYKHEAESGVRHIGPMAQDFYAAFGTGSSDKVIPLLDASGVALAAIKALTEQNAELRARLDTLESHVAAD